MGDGNVLKLDSGNDDGTPKVTESHSTGYVQWVTLVVWKLYLYKVVFIKEGKKRKTQQSLVLSLRKGCVSSASYTWGFHRTEHVPCHRWAGEGVPEFLLQMDEFMAEVVGASAHVELTRSNVHPQRA